MILLLLTIITTAAAQELPNCNTPAVITCAPMSLSCSATWQCVDDQGCRHNQIVYQQDCSATPKPNYCPPDAPAKNMLVLRDRKNCPK